MSFADKLSFGSFDGVPSRRRRLAGMSLGLVYLAFPITEVVSGEMRGIEAVWGIISILAYTAAYIATTLSPRDFHQSNRWTLPLMALTSIMAAAFALIFGGGWLTLPIYTVVLYAFILPPKRAVIGIAGMLVVVVACGIVDKADAGSIGVLGLQVVTMGVLFISVRNTRLLAHRLREAQGEVARLAATEERLRIARDLHDLLGHSLSLIVLKSELAGRMADDRPGVRGSWPTSSRWPGRRWSRSGRRSPDTGSGGWRRSSTAPAPSCARPGSSRWCGSRARRCPRRSTACSGGRPAKASPTSYGTRGRAGARST